LVLPALTIPSLGDTIAASGQVLWFCLAYAVLALLWYAPFFAWVGTLSTVVGRWSIPLAFLIPGLVVLGENLFVRGFGNLIMPMDGMRGGQVLNYLRQRSSFGLDDHDMFENAIENNTALDITGILNRFVAQIDWAQMGGGIIVAALLVYAASEYRRRVVLT
jgi:ABC-2 type transport system permease protein